MNRKMSRAVAALALAAITTPLLAACPGGEAAGRQVVRDGVKVGGAAGGAVAGCEAADKC